jgi:LPXTG-motif cell wall-anchored protein
VVEPPVEAFVEPEPAELPRTASLLPLLAAGGLGSLLAGLAVSLLRRRT